MTNNSIASNIVEKVFIEAKGLYNLHLTSMPEYGIAAVFTGLTAFYVAGYRQDNDLCLALTPTYQKRIMRFVNKSEFDYYTNILSYSYNQFRNSAVAVQYRSNDWSMRMIENFTIIMLGCLNISESDYSKELINGIIVKLHGIATNTGTISTLTPSVEQNGLSSKKPGFVISVLQFVWFVILYEVVTLVVSYIVVLMLDLLLSNSILSKTGIPDGIMYTTTPIIIAFTITSLYSLVFKKYYINKISAVLCFMVLSYVIVSHLIGIISNNGFLSWATVNQIWFDALLVGILFHYFWARLDIKRK